MKNIYKNLNNYELIDCGNYRKLERFGNFIIDRPSPTAKWQKKLPLDIWNKKDIFFDKLNKKWIKSDNNIPDNWMIKIENRKFSLKLAQNGQVGIFPEQLVNWIWLKKQIPKIDTKSHKILNGFAYTGGSTLFSISQNTELTHIDSAKASILQAKENIEISNLSNNSVRFITDDIITFLEKEVKRGNKYDAFILDPPAFGKGNKKKDWILKKDFDSLMELIKKLLSKRPIFIILSCHDKNLNKNILKQKLIDIGLSQKNIQTGNMDIISSKGNILPAGIFARWSTF